jgi:Flp pilus assembly protein TadD
VAVLIATAMAVQLHAHALQKSAVGQIGRDSAGVKDTRAQSAALDDALRVADLRPGSGGLFAAIGLETRAGHLASAERLALRATRREPDNFSTWLTLGVVRQTRGDKAGAAAAFTKVKRLNPLYPTPR